VNALQNQLKRGAMKTSIAIIDFRAFERYHRNERMQGTRWTKGFIFPSVFLKVVIAIKQGIFIFHFLQFNAHYEIYFFSSSAGFSPHSRFVPFYINLVIFAAIAWKIEKKNF
jgi:hypothetical protein